MHAFVNTAISAALKAGKIITRAFDNLDEIQVSSKAANDFVSNIDIASEQTIIEILQKAYPDHGFYCEEHGTQGNADSDHIWIIDPLDGTANFINGYPHFCISIALQINGRIEHGVVYNPLLDEMYSASHGAGAQCNNRRIRINRSLTLADASIGTVLPSSQVARKAQFYKTTEAISDHCRRIRLAGAAALDLCYVANNRLNGFYSVGLQEWDIAAASLIVKEAGGIVVDYKGENNFMERGNIIAAAPKVMKELFPLAKTLIK